MSLPVTHPQRSLHLSVGRVNNISALKTDLREAKEKKRQQNIAQRRAQARNSHKTHIDRQTT